MSSVPFADVINQSDLGLCRKQAHVNGNSIQKGTFVYFAFCPLPCLIYLHHLELSCESPVILCHLPIGGF